MTENREPPLGRSLPWGQSLHLSQTFSQLLYSVPELLPDTGGGRAFRQFLGL